jgi:hypothetical protein
MTFCGWDRRPANVLLNEVKHLVFSRAVGLAAEILRWRSGVQVSVQDGTDGTE